MEGEASVPIDYQVPLPQDWVPLILDVGAPKNGSGLPGTHKPFAPQCPCLGR